MSGPGPAEGVRPRAVVLPGVVSLPRAIATAIATRAVAELPNEACGLVIGSATAAAGGIPLRYEACRNADASPVRYTIHPDDLYRLTVAADEANEAIWGIVHSHVRSPAVPSTTDVGLAFYPDAVHILVSLAADQVDPVTGVPSLRAWWIVRETANEIALEVA